MFELSVALKYLIPKKKQLSVALIGLMSVGVVSLVVWLVLVFLSVTEGMEKNWLKKLTDLNAPLKITPTQKYYDSYYYKIDSISSSSDYQNKTLQEKFLAAHTDPYNAEEDGEIPSFWPEKEVARDGTLLDPVKNLYAALSELKSNNVIDAFQDYEMSGALLKLQLLRSDAPLFCERGQESVHFISQVSYISSFPDQNPYLDQLILPPSKEDINHLLFLSSHKLSSVKADRGPDIIKSFQSIEKSPLAKILGHIYIEHLKTSHPYWQIPFSLLHTDSSLTVHVREDALGRMSLIIPKSSKAAVSSSTLRKAILITKDQRLHLKIEGRDIPLQEDTPIFCEEFLDFHLLQQPTLPSADTSLPIMLSVETTLQGQKVKGLIPWRGLEITSCSPTQSFSVTPSAAPLWACKVGGKAPYMLLPTQQANEQPVILPKSFQDHGALIGDRGYLSYASTTTSSSQEQRLGVFVAGFYDPGIMSVGNKCILAPRQVTRAISSSNTTMAYDKISTAGVQVWMDDLSTTDSVKASIQKMFEENQIASYFTVSSYKEYDFAKELLQQFQSDKYLFSLIAILIITVACCNIISLMVLLVNDKKKEIGILMSMGASKKHIALIFALCGIIMGTLGCLLGCLTAFFTLKHIDVIVQLLSIMQGHNAFSEAFFGSKLPDAMSLSAMTFVLIITPILALLAGLIPAIKACSLKPSSILRSE